MSVRCCLSLLALSLSAGAARADEYGAWVKAPEQKVQYRTYKYETHCYKLAYQTVVVYYADPLRKHWAYYYNAQSQPWARCALPGNPKYDPRVMHWEKLDEKTGAHYVELPRSPVGPVPADGRNPIPVLTPPPAVEPPVVVAPPVVPVPLQVAPQPVVPQQVVPQPVAPE